MATPKIAVYSVPDLKNTTDDALPNYLTSIGFVQEHFLTDMRLGIGYTAVVIAAVTFFLDYKYGWDATKLFTLCAVALYFALNGLMTYWILVIERRTIFVGRRGDIDISIASGSTKNSPIYKLRAKWFKLELPLGEWKEVEIEAPFTKWFTADGYFVAKPFQQWLSSEVPPIGVAQREKTGDGQATLKSISKADEVKSPLNGDKTANTTGAASPGARSRKSKK